MFFLQINSLRDDLTVVKANAKKTQKNKKKSDFCLTIIKTGIYYMTSVRDIAQPGLARLTGGQKVRSSNLRIPTIFLPKFLGKKSWSRQASLHAPQVRFIYFDAWRAKLASTKCASYGEAVLHKSLTMKHCFVSLHNMKQLHYIPLWSIRFAHMMRK